MSDFIFFQIYKLIAENTYKNKTAIHLFSKIYSLFTGSLRKTVNEVIYRKIHSPDSSGKPMPVENHFFLVVAERLKEAPASG